LFNWFWSISWAETCTFSKNRLQNRLI